MEHGSAQIWAAALAWSDRSCSPAISRAGGSKVYYRLYLMRGVRIRDAIEIHAADDQAALATAEQSRGVLPAELWCRGRLVATFAGSAAA